VDIGTPPCNMYCIRMAYLIRRVVYMQPPLSIRSTLHSYGLQGGGCVYTRHIGVLVEALEVGEPLKARIDGVAAMPAGD
jgi:hypothetical protein